MLLKDIICSSSMICIKFCIGLGNVVCMTSGISKEKGKRETVNIMYIYDLLQWLRGLGLSELQCSEPG